MSTSSADQIPPPGQSGGRPHHRHPHLHHQPSTRSATLPMCNNKMFNTLPMCNTKVCNTAILQHLREPVKNVLAEFVR